MHLLDLCKNATCHQNATCNLYDEKKFANCSCNIGFGGDGRHCFGMYDVFMKYMHNMAIPCYSVPYTLGNHVAFTTMFVQKSRSELKMMLDKRLL